MMKYLTIGLLLIAMLLVFGCSEKQTDGNAADTSKGATDKVVTTAEPAAEEVEEVSAGVEEVDDLMTELDTTEIEDPGIDDTTFQ